MKINLIICVFVRLLNLISREKFEPEPGFEIKFKNKDLTLKNYRSKTIIGILLHTDKRLFIVTRVSENTEILTRTERLSGECS